MVNKSRSGYTDAQTINNIMQHSTIGMKLHIQHCDDNKTVGTNNFDISIYTLNNDQSDITIETKKMLHGHLSKKAQSHDNPNQL